MNVEIKDFEKDRVVYLSDEIKEETLIQLKKDFNKILQSDEITYADNCREVAKLGDKVLEVCMASICPSPHGCSDGGRSSTHGHRHSAHSQSRWDNRRHGTRTQRLFR